jgi:uncharacterized protein YbjT (DUF2867 family)
MKTILLIGATGQLGGEIFRKLQYKKDFITRIFIREDSNYQHLLDADPEIFFGDLKDYESIKKAVEGCDMIITTANSAAPRKREDSFYKVDMEGHMNLIDIAKEYGVEKFIYTSVLPPSKRFRSWVPLIRSKIAVENYLKASGLNYTIYQPDTFMDVYFTFLGTTIPVEGEPAALVNRPFKFMQNFYNSIKDNMDKGFIGIIGDGTTTHSYIAIDNVACFLVAATDHPETDRQTIQLGGPQTLSSLDVKAIFEKAFAKPLKIKRTPPFMMRLMGNIFSLFNQGASNIFKLNYMAATESSQVDSTGWAKKLGINLISAEEYLDQKLGVAVA